MCNDDVSTDENLHNIFFRPSSKNFNRGAALTALFVVLLRSFDDSQRTEGRLTTARFEMDSID
jgi:hypothetical protein